MLLVETELIASQLQVRAVWGLGRRRRSPSFVVWLSFLGSFVHHKEGPAGLFSAVSLPPAAH